MKVVHFKKEKFDVYIGRPNGSNIAQPSYEHFGNPFTHKAGTMAMVIVSSREEAVKNFRKWLLGEDWIIIQQDQRKWILDNLHTLKGKTLGCWCAPLPCHGDVLIELLNPSPSPQKQDK